MTVYYFALSRFEMEDNCSCCKPYSFLLLFIFTPVSPADVFSVGALPFLLSVSAVMVRILLQAYRFRYFINHFIGPNYSTTLKTMNARIAGEFVTQTTPSFIGGEIVRIAWLIKNEGSCREDRLVATAGNYSRCFCKVFGIHCRRCGNIQWWFLHWYFSNSSCRPNIWFWFLVVLMSANRNMQL